PAVVATRAPSARETWTAWEPIPPVPPWIRMRGAPSPVPPHRASAAREPRPSPPTIARLDQTVHATSGRVAASCRETPDGTGMTCPAGTTTFSAYPPPARRAQTSSPTAWPSTPSPTEAIRPEHSSPSTSDAPGGGGYRPRDWSRSARLTAVAATSIRTSPGPGVGSATSATWIDSGPSSYWIALMNPTVVAAARPGIRLGPLRWAASSLRFHVEHALARVAAGRRGSVAERPNALALKASEGNTSGGSNPSTSARGQQTCWSGCVSEARSRARGAIVEDACRRSTGELVSGVGIERDASPDLTSYRRPARRGDRRANWSGRRTAGNDALPLRRCLVNWSRPRKNATRSSGLADCGGQV